MKIAERFEDEVTYPTMFGEADRELSLGHVMSSPALRLAPDEESGFKGTWPLASECACRRRESLGERSGTAINQGRTG